ncbi:large ribosomal subunit protein mL40 [Pholidichthys leucotaenia]
MSLALSRCLCVLSSRQTAPVSFLLGHHHHAVKSPWFAPVMTIKTSAPLRAEPRKKKKTDTKRDQMFRDRMKKKLKKLEKVPPEFIPIEDFIVATKCLDETRDRSPPRQSLEESEGRAQLLKQWSIYKQEQHMDEVQAVELALKAQREALEELKLESEELYQEALKPDLPLFPFVHEGPTYTPANPKYEAPDGKYNDITKVYTQ